MPASRTAIAAVQQIYADNFFPEMKANWSTYPDNVGHMIWPGCFRCHDGLHKTEDRKLTIKADDCNACHTILAQGAGGGTRPARARRARNSSIPAATTTVPAPTATTAGRRLWIHKTRGRSTEPAGRFIELPVKK